MLVIPDIGPIQLLGPDMTDGLPSVGRHRTGHPTPTVPTPTWTDPWGPTSGPSSSSSSMSSTSSSVLDPTGMPTVVPDLPEWQIATGSVSGTAFWIGFVVMMVMAVVTASVSGRVRLTRRLFHLATTYIAIVSGMAYLAMAMHQGSLIKRIDIHERHRHGIPPTDRTIFREVFWASYLDGVLTMPVLVASLGLISGLDGIRLAMAVMGQLAAMVTAGFATASRGQEKWVWFAVSVMSYGWVVYLLALYGRRAAAVRGQAASRFFDSVGAFAVIVASTGPIIWLYSAGSRAASVDEEMVATTVVGLLLKVATMGSIVWAATAHEDVAVELTGFWADGLSRPSGRIRIDGDGGDP